MIRFSESETCKFVYLIRDHACLWNTTHEHYRSRLMRDAACEAIAYEMNLADFTAADVKLKLHSLKSTHRMEHKKKKKFAESGKNYVTNLKWTSIMDSFIKPLKNQHSPEDISSSETEQSTPESIFPEVVQLKPHCKINSETASVSVSSTPSLPSESEIEQSIRSISNPEVITVIPEIQSIQPVSHSQVVIVSPETVTVKSVSSPEVIPVTSRTSTAKSVSNPEIIKVTPEIQQRSLSNHEVTAVPSGIQTVKSSTTPKYFTLIPDNTSTSSSTPKYIMVTPEIQTSKSISNPELITVSSGSNQNVGNISGSQVFAFAPEMQQRIDQVSSDVTLESRKRRYEEVSSTNSNNEFRQNNDFNDRCEDEMDAFGRFVALNLRKMTMESALAAQTEVLSVLTRRRLNDSKTNPPSKQTYPYILANGISSTQNSVGPPTALFKR